jgi:predicted dehydrogenase
MGVHLYGTAAGAYLNDHSLHLYQVGEEALVQTAVSLKGGLATFTAQATNFINAVRGLEASRTPAAHGTLLMQMLEAIYRSGREGQEVSLSA